MVDRSNDRERHESDLIELERLSEMHSRLPGELVLALTNRAALGLQRNDHSSGADLVVAVQREESIYCLRWIEADLSELEQHDFQRISEDGAEAIALVVAHETRGWRVVRRLQRGENADWLLEQEVDGTRRLVAFEISGTDGTNVKGRMREKLIQVAKSLDVDDRWAGVVGFQRPITSLQSVRMSGHES